MGVYAARRDWLRDNRETGVRFLRAILMANDVMQKDPGIGVKAPAVEMGIRETWVAIPRGRQRWARKLGSGRPPRKPRRNDMET